MVTTAITVLTDGMLDDRFATVGTSGSGKTYAMKGLAERKLAEGARVCVVDPLGVWWGLRSNRAGNGPGYPVVVFGGRYADVALTDAMGAQLGRIVGTTHIQCVIDLSGLGSGAAVRRLMTAFCEALYEVNTQPLHLVFDEADLFAPQKPMPEARRLLGLVDEIVRRGRVRGFIPWLISQRPAVLNKDVLSMADVLIAMRLTSSQDRKAIGGWIEGQADREDGKRILATLPRLQQGEGYVWAPAVPKLERVYFDWIRTFDSSKTPKRGEKGTAPTGLAEVDISAIVAALAIPPVIARAPEKSGAPDQSARIADLEQHLAAERAKVRDLEARLGRLTAWQADLGGLVAKFDSLAGAAGDRQAALPIAQPPQPRQYTPAAAVAERRQPARQLAGLHPAARKLLAVLAQLTPARFTWGQAATLASLKPSGGHFNAGRKDLRDRSYVAEDGDLVAASEIGLSAAGEVPPAPANAAERLEMWCARLPSPAPDILRRLVANGGAAASAFALAEQLGKKPSGGHWNSGVAMLRNNGLIEVLGHGEMRAAEALRS